MSEDEINAFFNQNWNNIHVNMTEKMKRGELESLSDKILIMISRHITSPQGWEGTTRQTHFFEMLDLFKRAMRDDDPEAMILISFLFTHIFYNVKELVKLFGPEDYSNKVLASCSPVDSPEALRQLIKG